MAASCTTSHNKAAAFAILFICLLAFSATPASAAESCYCQCVKRCSTVPDIGTANCNKACETGCIFAGEGGAENCSG